MGSTVIRSATRRTARLAGNLTLVGVILVSLGFLVPSLAGYERYVITGGSMSGTFERGSVAFEKPVPVGDLAVGDIITYLPPADAGISNLVTHRIAAVKVDDQGQRVFRTKGDANADVDPWRFQLSAPTQPRVQFTVPAIGYVFIALADRTVRILLIGVPAALVALHSLLELVRALRPAKQTHASVSDRLVPAQRAPLTPASPNTAPELVRTPGV